MTLKGASLEHEGPPRADRWSLDDGLTVVARVGAWTPGATCSNESLGDQRMKG